MAVLTTTKHFSPDLENPPDGGYPFIEWEDYDFNERFEKVLEEADNADGIVRQAVKEWMDDHPDAGLKATRLYLVEVMKARVIQKEAEAAREAAKCQYSDEKALDLHVRLTREYKEAGLKVLVAQPFEIQMGRLPATPKRKVVCPKDTKAWVAWREGGMLPPGGMVVSITTCDAFPSKTGLDASGKPVYNTWVFNK
jgi:hypothetical protein